jgi:hypothetical protein
MTCATLISLCTSLKSIIYLLSLSLSIYASARFLYPVRVWKGYTSKPKSERQSRSWHFVCADKWFAASSTGAYSSSCLLYLTPWVFPAMIILYPLDILSDCLGCGVICGLSHARGRLSTLLYLLAKFVFNYGWEISTGFSNKVVGASTMPQQPLLHHYFTAYLYSFTVSSFGVLTKPDNVCC